MPPSMRRSLVIVELVVLAVAGAAPADVSAVRAERPGRSGVNQDLAWDPADQVASEIGLMREAGVEWLRLPLRWSWIEPQRGVARWERVDGVVAAAHHAGLHLLAVLGGTPTWASGIDVRTLARRSLRDAFAPASTADFAGYVAAVARRYRGVIGAYEIFNEPNASEHWMPQPDPDRFVELLCAANDAIKEADPRAQVVVGGLNGNGLTLGWEPASGRDFLKAIYARGGARCFDVMAIHPYAHPLEDGVAVLQSWIDATRGYMTAQGDRRPLWITEVGWASGIPLWGHSIVTEAQQAEWVRAVYGALRGADKVFWYQLKEDPDAPAAEAHWGWLRPDLAPKPAYAAFREMTRR